MEIIVNLVIKVIMVVTVIGSNIDNGNSSNLNSNDHRKNETEKSTARLTSTYNDGLAVQHVGYTPTIVPMIDNGSPYSYIGQIELHEITTMISDNNVNVGIEPMPYAIIYRPFLQYGVG